MAMNDSQIKQLMDMAEHQALKALAGYKFWMFGYHAARWVQLNRMLDTPGPNPFQALVKLSREILNESQAN